MKLRRFAPCVVLVLAACVHNPPSSAVRICDDRGCAERPKNQVSADTVDRVQDLEADARIENLKRLAEGNPAAAHDLGLRYFRGDGIRQDSYQALVWMRKAAESGDLQAQKALGSFYLFGLEEMGADPREAEKWLTIAAGRGDDESRRLLAQASAAKRSEELDRKWRTQWRATYYRYWYSDYPYRGYWRQHAWYWN